MNPAFETECELLPDGSTDIEYTNTHNAALAWF